MDLLARNRADTRGLNSNFRGDSPFNELRVKLFAQHWVNDRVGVFSEFLFDSGAAPRVNGAYVVVNEIGGRPWLGLRAGLAPAVTGTFGLRSTYFNSNPLVGVPLAWQHRTTLDPFGQATAEDMVRRRDQDFIGLPMIYETCWNLQWELMGHSGPFEYSVGVTPGSLSNPSGANANDGIQVLARVGWAFSPGFRMGASAAQGPYLGGIPPTADPLLSGPAFDGDTRDYDQTLLGYDLEWLSGRFQVISEGFASTWEAPLIAEDLTAYSAYVEVRADVSPRWIVAGRLGGMKFNEINTADGSFTWDDDVVRSEGTVTYRWSRELQVRGGWQHTAFVGGAVPAEDLFVLQLRAAF